MLTIQPKQRFVSSRRGEAFAGGMVLTMADGPKYLGSRFQTCLPSLYCQSDMHAVTVSDMEKSQAMVMKASSSPNGPDFLLMRRYSRPRIGMVDRTCHTMAKAPSHVRCSGGST